MKLGKLAVSFGCVTKILNESVLTWQCKVLYLFFFTCNNMEIPFLGYFSSVWACLCGSSPLHSQEPGRLAAICTLWLMSWPSGQTLTNTTVWVAYKQQELYFSQFWRLEIQGQTPAWWALRRSSSGLDWLLVSTSSCWGKGQGSSRASLLKALIHCSWGRALMT